MLIRKTEELKKQITQLNKAINNLPEGNLSIGHSRGSFKWFYTKNGKQTYIKKKDLTLAKKLAIKKYLTLKVEILEARLKEEECKSKHSTLAEDKLEKLLNDSGYLELLSDYLSAYSHEHQHWMYADYPRNTNHPENLIHQTVGGLLVRSKSESMIAISLSEHNIPFRYENILEIDSIPFAPDFTILNPKDDSLIYWEHFGLIDNEKYLNDMIYKIKAYAKENIILGDNLIITYETKTSPLNFTTINNTIKQFFY